MYPNVKDEKRQTYLDFGIGMVVDALERNDHMNNMVFIFLSDNGGDLDFGASNIPLRGDKGDLWEGGTKSVRFVYSPKYLVQIGYIHNGMIDAVDWFSTILDIARYQQDETSVWLKFKPVTFDEWLGATVCGRFVSEAKPDHLDSVNQWKYLKKCSGSGRNEFVYNIDDDITKSAALRVDIYKQIIGDPRVYVFNSTTYIASVIDPNNTDVSPFDLHTSWMSLLKTKRNSDVQNLNPGIYDEFILS